MAVCASVDSNYKVKDVDAWTKDEVRAFLSDVLPKHPCINNFQYTSGHVLVTLEKEDIRRQAKDEEAANVIWAELQKFQKGTRDRGLTTAGVPASGAYTIFVRTPAEVAMEFEVSPSDTVAVLKTRLSDLEGTPVENQRLVWNGINMADHRTLASYNICNGACVLLVPHLSASQRFVPPPAPRGMLMVPGNKSWQPSHAAKPYMPVTCSDVHRPFAISIEFESVPDYRSFMTTQQCHQQGDSSNAPILEIHPKDSSREPVQTRVYLDSETEMLRLDTMGDIAEPNARYRGMMHVGGEQKQVTLTTGNRIG